MRGFEPLASATSPLRFAWLSYMAVLSTNGGHYRLGIRKKSRGNSALQKNFGQKKGPGAIMRIRANGDSSGMGAGALAYCAILVLTPGAIVSSLRGRHSISSSLRA